MARPRAKKPKSIVKKIRLDRDEAQELATAARELGRTETQLLRDGLHEAIAGAKRRRARERGADWLVRMADLSPPRPHEPKITLR